MKRNIITNKIKCNHCGDIIESKHTWDFKYCSCKNIAIDGGHSYLKRMFTKGKEDYEDLSEIEYIEEEEKSNE